MEIQPEKQNIDRLFSNESYKIDFYQREYKWGKQQIETMVNDFFHNFEPDFSKNESIEPTRSNIIENYSWYYLNTYITNRENEVYLVDGQQRLTTLTIFLMVLYKKAAKDIENKELLGWLERKIVTYTSDGKTFFIGDEDRKRVVSFIFENDIEEIKEFKPKNVTEKNIQQNYLFLAKELNERLDSKNKLLHFIYYALLRIVIINLEVGQTDVPMVFEVINDRGIGLQPYEILKGKLLSQIPKVDLRPYEKIWDSKINPLADTADEFFRTYLKARFAGTRAEGRKFDGDYQRVIYSPPHIEELQINEISGVKKFLESDLNYYVDLFKKVKKLSKNYDEEFEYVRFNSLTEMDSQEVLILSSCTVKDEEEKEKIKLVSYLVDRAYVLLHLNKAYDSNRFYSMVYKISEEIRGQSADKFNVIFNKNILDEINERRSAPTTNLLEDRVFRGLTRQDFNKRFLRYYLARIEKYLADGIGKNMQDELYNLVRNTGKKNGYHIEHIISDNYDNRQLFESEEEFEMERNKLGALLLLRGRDNQSSNNEPFTKKKITYSGTLYWNQSLLQEFYKSKLDNRDFINEYGYDMKPYNDFDKIAVTERTQLLYEMTKNIWNVD
ncbi:DUF262 domain-containing protein [Rhodohalobacter halophilus]|uniref:DUF262 domain-containing protein n=1 Tax=Rhodohalobacter halophilus TaxID=1812810 RepID=UPI00083F8CEB|nr:DUF262 domain-containing protein [Rhodohalobacter halophilus]